MRGWFKGRYYWIAAIHRLPSSRRSRWWSPSQGSSQHRIQVPPLLLYWLLPQCRTGGYRNHCHLTQLGKHRFQEVPCQLLPFNLVPCLLELGLVPSRAIPGVRKDLLRRLHGEQEISDTLPVRSRPFHVVCRLDCCFRLLPLWSELDT